MLSRFACVRACVQVRLDTALLFQLHHLPMQNIPAEFHIAAFNPTQFPNLDLPEVAFVGRSNVGKSSLINALLGHKGLAKVSATPGRTQSVNFIKVKGSWFLVDLPGYGFAQVGIAIKEKWQALIEAYLVQRDPLQGVVLIVDIRREPMDSDLQMLEFLLSHEIPVLIVATKVDKLSKNQANQQLRILARAFQVEPEAIVCFSALDKTGREDLWQALYSLLQEGNGRMRELRVAREQLNKEMKQKKLDGPASVREKSPRGSAKSLTPVVVTDDDGSF